MNGIQRTWGTLTFTTISGDAGQHVSWSSPMNGIEFL
jgi:hypothetical protein